MILCIKQDSTIGLLTLDEMRQKQDTVVKEREKKIAQKKAEKEQKKMAELEAKRAQKELQKKQIKALSFMGEDEGDEEEDDEDEKVKDPAANDTSPADQDSENTEDDCSSPVLKKKKIGKNPDVDTSFLPDRDREEEENKLREQLRQVHVTKC